MCVQCAVAQAQSQLDSFSWFTQVSLTVITLITSVHKIKQQQLRVFHPDPLIPEVPGHARFS